MLKKICFLILLASVHFLPACAPPKEADLRYLLPTPPDTPRLEWLGTYASEDDFKKTEAERRMELIVGKPPQTLFVGPSGIAADGEGKVFVGDMYLKNIEVYNFINRTVTPLAEDMEIEPRQMLVDSNKQLYVADSKRKAVLVFSREGKLLRTYGSSKEFQKPLGVAIDEVRKRLYVSDGPSGQILVFDTATGKQVSTIGEGIGGKEGQLYTPAGLALDKAGNLYVVEIMNARISVFDAEGKFQHYFGTRDDTLRGFENPRGLQVDSEGNLWVIDFRRGALRAFNKEGVLLFALESPASHKMGFANPSAIYIDNNDEVYIADFFAKRFSWWRYLSEKNLKRYPVTAEDLEKIKKELAPSQAQGKK